jgi:phenylacetate-CoA oxygenase PaaI subunit
VSEEPAPPAQGLFEAAADADATARAVAAAAPSAPERVDLGSLQALDPAVQAPLAALLGSLADNKYVLGRRYAEWCTGAPMLESAVAAAAMAQDELGHARSFYPLLRGFGSDSQIEERGWQARPTSAMACLDRQFGSWADFIAANVLVDSALTTLLGAATESSYEPLRQRARKILQEEAGHWVHGSGWLQRMAASSAAAETAAALARMWDGAFTWLGQPEDPTLAPLVERGLLAEGPDRLRAKLRARLAPLLEAAGLAEPLLGRRLPWERWNAQARRLQPEAQTNTASS